jgi:hypothetical protein
VKSKGKLPRKRKRTIVPGVIHPIFLGGDTLDSVKNDVTEAIADFISEGDVKAQTVRGKYSLWG